MKKKLLFVLIFHIPFLCFSQQENSLLWKISGNGLQKDSYLYGTMHVSQKIAFHLDDVFYKALKSADIISLESDPNLWLDYIFENQEFNYYMNSYNPYGNKGFYNTSFELPTPKREEITGFLAQESQILNSILYRTNRSSQDFEEDTYLDMFIYQGGSKFGKKIASLEGVEQSNDLVERASVKPGKDKPDVWLQKRLQDDNYYTLLNNAYRDRKIHLLDSLSKGLYTENYMNFMMYKRNEIMVNNMDSIMKTGSLFAGIGAAHLAGDKGVLNLLRTKGYKVTAFTSEKTELGQKLKSEFENKIVSKKHIEQTSSDGFFTVNLPKKIYETTIKNNVIYLSPDLTNGAYTTISRINTFDYLNPLNKRTIKDIEDLLYESIPGKIISKKAIHNNGFDGLDIVNKTKNGNVQRYHIYLSPLEIIIFKMGGQKDFVSKEGDAFFNSIKFNKVSSKIVTLSPKQNGFKVAIPDTHTFLNKTKIGDRLIQAFTQNNTYYFVQEVINNDTDYIEEDAFELERIQQQFCKNLDLTFNKGEYINSKYPSYISSTTLKDTPSTKLHLKTVIRGAYYYLLGCVSSEKNAEKDFFNSFKITENTYTNSFKKRKDTTLHFSVLSPVKLPKQRQSYYNSNDKKKPYLGVEKNMTVRTNANEKIDIYYEKYHDYKSVKHIDTLWNRIVKPLGKKRAKYYQNLYKRLYVTDKKTGKDKNGHEQFTYLVRDSLSTRAIMVKHVLKDGVKYKLKTLIDTISKPSPFVISFYDSFTPKDSVIGRSLFENKSASFIEALKKNDSLIFDSYEHLSFENKDAKALIKLIDKFNFKDDQMQIRTQLIKELGKLEDKRIIPFLEKLYIDSYENSYDQIAIIKSILNNKDKKSYKQFLNLLSKDIPLTDKSYEVSSMFYALRDSLVLSKDLFPELLNYTTIPEYKEPIYDLLVSLKDSSFVNEKIYQNVRKQILTEAKIELKRQLSKKVENNSYNEYGSSYDYESNSQDNVLYQYTKLLFPYRKETDVKNFLQRLERIENNVVKATLISLQLQNNENPNKKLLNSLAANIKSRAALYKALEKINKTTIFPKEYRNQNAIAKAILFDDSGYNPKKKDSLEFIKKHNLKIGKKTCDIFFYKTKNHKNEYADTKPLWKLNYIAIEQAKDNKISTKVFDYEISIDIDQTKPFDEVLDQIIEKITLKDRKRVQINNSNNYYGGF